VEEIAMKKPRIVANLLTVDDICTEAFEARAQLLESRGMGTSRKKEDREFNTADQGNDKDRGDRGYRGKQTLD
jgi:hypothetical protein